jgi:pimeloyl-ACP methyl ester carboxylesterase
MNGQPVYCISGLGADEKIFSKLSLHGYELKHLPWLRPGRKESIQEYAKRMAASVKDEAPVMMGVSFGGMVAIEIAKQLPLSKLILVSSVKSSKELPRWMRMSGMLLLNKILPIRSYKFTEKIDNSRLGVSNEEEKAMAAYYRKKADPVYLQWAVDQVLNWNNEWYPEHTVHIHGNKDRIFPLKKLEVHHVIEDGTHFMIYNRAADISRILLKELESRWTK